jgi:hypothetical protein
MNSKERTVVEERDIEREREKEERE